MSLFHSLAATALLSAWSCGPALATEVVYSLQGLPVMTFDMPDGWNLTEGPDVGAAQVLNSVPSSPRVYSIRPPKIAGVMWTGLWVPEHARNAREFATYVRHLRPRLLESVKVNYRDQRVVNGLPITIVGGHGTRDGVGLDIVMAGVQLTPKTLAVVCFIGEPQLFDQYETDLSDMLATVRPATGATK